MAESYYIDDSGRVRFVMNVANTAYALKTAVENVNALIDLDMLKPLMIGDTNIPLTEIERFINEYAGQDISQLIKDHKQQKKLNDQVKVMAMR